MQGFQQEVMAHVDQKVSELTVGMAAPSMQAFQEKVIAHVDQQISELKYKGENNSESPAVQGSTIVRHDADISELKEKVLLVEKQLQLHTDAPSKCKGESNPETTVVEGS